MKDYKLINRLRNKIAERGVLGLSKIILNTLSNELYYSTSSVWYERDLSEPVIPFSPNIQVKIEFLVDDKVRLIEWLKEHKNRYPWIYFEEEVESALIHKHVFLLLLHEDCIIGYVKIGVGHTYIHDFDCTIKFQPQDAFIYDTFTLPEYRGKSLALYALNHVCDYFKTQNFKRIVCHIESWNLASIKTFEKAGFRAIDSIRFIRAACIPFFVRRGYVPFLSLESYLSRVAVNE